MEDPDLIAINKLSKIMGIGSVLAAKLVKDYKIKNILDLKKAYENIKLEPRVLINVEERCLKTKLLDTEYDLPFGFAPMGMCNLTWPNADTMLAKEAIKNKVNYIKNILFLLKFMIY